jgi:hypothetical protein
MNLRAAFLAQEASQNADGTFMVWRGGINEFQVPVFPMLVRTSLVLRIEADPEESRRLHTIRIRIVYMGQPAPWQEIPAAFKEPMPPLPVSYLNLLVTLGFGVVQPGEGAVELAVDGELVAPSLLFTVKQVPMPPGLFPSQRRTG